MLLLLSKIAWYLNGRPLLLGEEPDSFVLHTVINAAIARFLVFAVCNITLSRFPIIMPIVYTITLYFAWNGGWTDIYCLGNVFFFVPFWSKIKIVYLCSEVNCLYISNAKLIKLWETAVSLFVFLALLVEFSLDGGFSPPKPLGVFWY